MASSSTDDPRAAKLRKLNGLRRHVPYMSASAMSSLMQEIHDHGLPELHNRAHLAEATDQELNSFNAYGQLLYTVPAVSKTELPTEIVLVNPLSLLYAAYEQGGSLTELIDKAMADHPSTPHKPWRLLVYFDEVVPGNPIGYANKRKVWVCYVSFAEYGAVHLQNEASWLPVMEIRSNQVDMLAAGISQVCALILKAWFCNSECDVRNAGIVLKSPTGESHRIFVAMSMILQDGAAHKYVFHTKGDSGTKICMLCRNLFGVRTDIIDPETGQAILKASITYEHECDFATDDDIRNSMIRLVHKKHTLDAEQFKKWQQAVGFNFQPHGLLLDAALHADVQPASQYVHDWMHTMLVTGVFHTVMYLLICSLKAAKACGGNVYGTLSQYVSLWVHPVGRTTGKLHECFSKAREDSNTRAHTFKCTASDGLSLFPIIAMFVTTAVLKNHVCVLACNAFLAMADLIDMFQATATKHVSPKQLSQTVYTFLKSCVDAGWEMYMHPKFHWLVHFPAHLKHHGFLPSCWVHERKHKVSKRYANDIKNTSVYELSLLKQVLSHELALLKQPGLFKFDVCLIKPRKASAKAFEFLSSCFEVPLNADLCFTSSTVNLLPAGSCSKKDVVLLRSDDGAVLAAGEIWMHSSCNGRCMSLVSMWILVEYTEPTGFAKWQRQDNPKLISTSQILCATTYTVGRNDRVTTFIPLPFR
jgi:hypothetical protein